MKPFPTRLAWIALAVMLLPLNVGRLNAASQSETREYEGIVKDFNISEWGRAEEAAIKFTSKYNTNSEYFAKVVLIQAQAQYKEKKYTAMVELLTIQQGHAGSLGDQFTYWLAEGYYSGSDYHAAADAFARLVKDYPASPLRAQAMFDEAEARSRLQDWASVVDGLGRPDGAFQQMAKTNASDPSIVRGLLLLSEAQAKQNNYVAAEATLQGIPPVKNEQDLECKRLYLLSDAQLEAGNKEQAQQTSARLVEAAKGKPDWIARGMNLQGRIFEQMDLLPDAVKIYDAISQNDDLPADQRRQAFLKSVGLTFRQGKADEVEKKLTDYFNTHPEADQKGLEALMRGEFTLKNYFLAKNGATIPGATNSLALAKTEFEAIIASTNGEYVGNAQLDLGWCLWEEKKYPESLVAFRAAVQQLPFSVEQATARFKVGDVLYQTGDFAGAAQNYNAVIDQYGALTAVKNELFERALYQLVRTGLGETNVDMATGALKRILELFPDSLMSQSSTLLVGQGLSDRGNTAEARKVFQDFVTRWDQSALVPEVKLAIARTYEMDRDWLRALAEYEEWMGAYKNSPTLPRALFARARANYEAGQETNAFNLFTNFVAQFPSNELALKAQYWVGDYYWRQQDFVSAEAQYQEVYKNKHWPESKLQYEALMMAGRAAMLRENYGEAFGYFTNLFLITNCPLDLRLQASFAAGDAKMASAVTGATTNLSAYTEAVDNYYKPMTADKFSSNRIAALAWGRMGDCYQLLAAGDPAQFKQATNAYQKVMNSPLAGITARSMAECGLAKTLESMARLKPIGTQREGLMEAASHYLNVAEGKNRRDNETTDPFWVKEAGKAAGALDEELGEWSKAEALYDYLAGDLPSWKSYWDKRVEVARAKEKQLQDKPPEKN